LHFQAYGLLFGQGIAGGLSLVSPHASLTGSAPGAREMTETELRDLAVSISTACTLRGEFLLRSGTTTDHYFDKYQFEARPDLLRPLASRLGELLPPQTEVLAGLELGGIPLATAVSLHTGLSTTFVRKHAKAYGTQKAIEGPSVDGKRVTVIEDVVTTGGQIIESVAMLRKEGAIVDHVVCAIWRGSDLTPLRDAGLTMIWAFSASDL
jgi:orotate phosphoribosyltransferase